MPLPVMFSIFMKNHKYEDPKHFYRIVFMDVGFHEPGLIFMKIHISIFMSTHIFIESTPGGQLQQISGW